MAEEIQEITENIEYLFVRKIIERLRDGGIGVEQARDLAKKFLAIEPFISLEDAKKKVAEFAESNAEFNGLMEYLDAFHEEKHIDKKIGEVREQLKNNMIEEAIKVAEV